MQLNSDSNSDRKTIAENYWMKKLAGDPEKRSFPYDYKASPLAERIIDSFHFTVPDDLCISLNEFCRNSDLRLYKALLAGLIILLDKYSYEGLNDVTIGAPVFFKDPDNGKPVESKSPNSVIALRNYLDDNMSFNELLLGIKQTVLEAFEHQDYPIQELLKKMNIPYSEDDFPLFEIALCLEHFQDRKSLQHIPLNMIFSFRNDQECLKGVVEYDTSLYEKSTIERLINHLFNVMKEVLAGQGMELSALDVLSDQERDLLLRQFNDTPLEYPKDKTLNHVFEEQVLKTPNHIAVADTEKMLTFSGLDQFSNRLAHKLREKGVKQDTIVGLMVERTVEMMVGIMGIVKAGGAYMPIGLTIPEARREFMLEDSKSVVFLTQRHLVPKENAPENIMYLEDAIADGNNTAPDIINEPSDLAYVIYTSGTTGKPKGVMVQHDNTVNLVYGLHERIYKDYGQNLRVALVAPYIFDASVQQIFGVTLLGHALYIVPENSRVDGFALLEFYQRHRIEVSDGTPSHLRLLLGASQEQPFDIIVKHFLIGGEALAKQAVDAFINNFPSPHPIVTNVYGPTECCVDSTSFRITREIIPTLKGDIITIGKPMPNEQVYIVNKKMALQPLGAPGELCIGGDGVSRGYMGREKLTGEKFIPNPLSKSGVIYRTGDITKWLPDGNIAFMDRIDHQVKIRGFRIEIGEIESQVLKRPDVKETVVLARDDGEGEKYLCAYLVPEKSGEVDIPALRDHLAGALPSYMVPAYYVTINSIPLTPNGKVNRKALPEPDLTEKGADYVPPETDVEKKLVKVWAEVLKKSEDVVGIDENFFNLGGHSLKAAVMITLIHKMLDVKIKMHEIFERPTIRELAQFIGGVEEEKYEAIPLAKPADYYPQTSMQRRLYFIDQLEEKNTVYNIQMMDIYCKGIEKDRLEDAFRKLIQRHESLRTSFHTVEGEAVQKIHDYKDAGANFQLEYYETNEDGMIYSSQPGKEWTRVTGIPFQDVVEHFIRPFDIGKAPILRAGLVKIWGDTQILMVDMHHIMSDGISMVVLINDLWALYDEENLPQLPIQYKDFAVWHNSDTHKKMEKAQEAFWLKEFSGDISPLNLPYDFPRPAKLSFEGDAVHFEINSEQANIVNTLAREYGDTLYMMLFAAYNVLLAKLTGQDEIIAGTVTGGRGHADVQDLIGMFVGTLALRNYPTSDKTFKQFLGELKDRTLDAFENQDFPFEELVSKVAPQHDRNRNPLFDVAFGLENEAEKSEEYLLEALMLDFSNPYRFNERKSKFDLMLTAVEAGEGMQFTLEYNIQLFKTATVERFAKYYKKILTSICSDIDQKIAEIDIISKVEKNQIIYEFNDTKVDHPRDKTIHQMFIDCVEKTPDNIAMKFNGETMTYRETNERANQLARQLRKKQVGPDKLVGIMVERSFEMIVGIFGIIKAGGAYLPIDPNYPEDRIRYLFKDSSSQLLLTQAKHIAFAEKVEFDGQVLNLDDKALYKGDASNIDNINDPTDMAYVIYTSGSTGKPKGVVIEHVSAINLLLFLDNMYPLEADDAYLLKTAFLFDVSVSEIFGWFWRGGRLEILQQGGEKDPLLMIEKIAEEKVTHLNFVPSMFNVFVNMLEKDNIHKLAPLRYIFLAGEAIWPDSVLKFRELNSTTLIENLYGPTEATVYASWYPVANWKGSGSVSIGKAPDNLKLYIVSTDEHSRPKLQPIGIAGELTISGIQLARGYLNRPQLTSEKFVDNPYAAAESHDPSFKKIYHTGDLCRWGIDGNVEYMGRIDFQVKVRGFRIELGEIESRLSDIDEIKEGVVIVKEDKEGEKYLCSYLVSDQKLDIPQVRETLTKNLPSYMVPSYFMQIDAIPLNPSGKLDRKALPEPEIEAFTREYIAPTNDTEKEIADVCSEVLGIEKIGIDDNFFEIGGDSIKTILISAKLQKRGLDVNVNDFFAHTTIRKLAQVINPMEDGAAEEATVRDEAKVAEQVAQATKAYLQQVREERWPDLSDTRRLQHVMITGATGYLGSYLTAEMLTLTKAVVYLPIRGDSQEAAEKRFKERFLFYFGDKFYNAHKGRLIVLKADLKEEKLGIEAKKYDEMTQFIEAVVHSAANVKHFGLYEEFHRDNVVATENLLDFALTGKRKDFHFVSTLDTGRGNIDNKDFLLYTEYCHDEGQKTEEVYLKSKMEAERRVLAYREKGLNTSIYRAANMTFHSKTGRFQANIEDNFFYSMLRAYVKVGFWSRDMVDLEFDLSYVNEAACAIVSLVKARNLENGIYHICNPHAISWQQMGQLLKETGLPVTDLPPEEVAKGLSQYEGNSDYERIIERVKVYAWEWEEKTGTLTVPKMDRTVTLLEKLGFQWTKPDAERIQLMIKHCQDVEFL